MWFRPSSGTKVAPGMLAAISRPSASVVPQQAVAVREAEHKVPLDRAAQVVIEMGEPVWRADDRRAVSEQSVSEPPPVRGSAKANFLLHRLPSCAAQELFLYRFAIGQQVSNGGEVVQAPRIVAAASVI